jgi:nucleoside-diphosphate-sugar epimerase
VLCNTLIYGHGRGLARDSVQLPTLRDHALRTGVVRHVGRGLNVWSHVHVDDVAEVYALALAKAPAGLFAFVENGEASYRALTTAMARALSLGAPQGMSVEEAIALWGVGAAVYSLGSNSRVRGRRARKVLGWNPRGVGVIDWIGTEMMGSGLEH